jgi:hypothetical protein
MSVVVATLGTEGGVNLVADSQVSDPYSKLNGYPDKIWVERDLGYIIGSCGSIRTAQVVRFATDWPRYREDEHDLPKFAVLEVVPAIKTALEHHGLLKEKNGVETMDSDFIIAWGENFFSIEEDFSVLMPIKGRIAIGSGYAEAYGALGDEGYWSLDETIEAVRRSTLTAHGVGGDIYFVTTNELITESVENV